MDDILSGLYDDKVQSVTTPMRISFKEFATAIASGFDVQDFLETPALFADAGSGLSRPDTALRINPEVLPDWSKTGWQKYLHDNWRFIQIWLKKFARARVREAIEMAVQDKKYEHISFLLSQAWAEAPDTPEIRSTGFFFLCDLLDGGWEG